MVCVLLSFTALQIKPPLLVSGRTAQSLMSCQSKCVHQADDQGLQHLQCALIILRPGCACATKQLPVAAPCSFWVLGLSLSRLLNSAQVDNDPRLFPVVVASAYK